MSEFAIGLLTLACVYAGALAGLRLQRRLPEHHLRDDSKDVVRLVSGLLATLSALVLGLLIASAKGAYDQVSDGIRQSAAKVVVIDRLLGEYGPEAKPALAQLKLHYAQRFAQLQFMVNVGEAEAQLGDEVVLLGGGISAHDLAAWMGTNEYEVLTSTAPGCRACFTETDGRMGRLSRRGVL